MSVRSLTFSLPLPSFLSLLSSPFLPRTGLIAVGKGEMFVNRCLSSVSSTPAFVRHSVSSSSFPRQFSSFLSVPRCSKYYLCPSPVILLKPCSSLLSSSRTQSLWTHHPSFKLTQHKLLLLEHISFLRLVLLPFTS